MLKGNRDTIAAIATPAGVGGVGIVRVSGEESGAILARLTGRNGASFVDRKFHYGVIRDSAGQRIDDVLYVFMGSPHSYTGEDTVEIHGHGGSINMGRLLRAVVESGARHAAPGEFTRRAFENDKMDLSRAEAVIGVIEAESERAWRIAQAQLDGELGSLIDSFRVRCISLMAQVEACIDFPEEGEDYFQGIRIGETIDQLAVEIDRLACTAELGKALREGVDVAIVGPVNSGKSSLFNKLLGSERAIVTDTPGTTRDFVEAKVVWEGVAITLIDTAGSRSGDNSIGAVERRGIEMGEERARMADHKISVLEANSPGEHEFGALRIASKIDTVEYTPVEGVIGTSVITEQGIQALKDAVIQAATGGVDETASGSIITSERQRALLCYATAALRCAKDGVAAKSPIELIASDLRMAGDRLFEVIGKEVGDEVLDELFQRFCIGK